MRKPRAIWAALVSLSVSVGVAAALAIAPASADAATPGPPLTKAKCSGDLCVRVYVDDSAPNMGTVLVHEWARNATFYGHFELQVPGVKKPYNSKEETWHAGGAGPSPAVPNNNGTYTSRAWFWNGSNWQVIGTVTMTGGFM
jgi:hypothetical protein